MHPGLKSPSESVHRRCFCEALSKEVAQFNIGVTMVEPGGARTEFRSKGLAPGDPVRMAKCIIESADKESAPLRMVLGSQALSPAGE